jgi:hypothetical protein
VTTGWPLPRRGVGRGRPLALLVTGGNVDDSTWLKGGRASPIQVAEWAGHSVAVLLHVYAKCLDGQDATARRGVEAALRQE